MVTISQTMSSNAWIQINISLKFVSRGPINNIPTLVQIMAWRRPGDKPLSEPMMVSFLTQVCVTQHQWVKTSAGTSMSQRHIFVHVAAVWYLRATAMFLLLLHNSIGNEVQKWYLLFCVDWTEITLAGHLWNSNSWVRKRSWGMTSAQCLIVVVLLNYCHRRNVNILRPRQNGCHFANDICKCIFSNKNFWILIEMSLKYHIAGNQLETDYSCIRRWTVSSSVEVMGCRRVHGDVKPLLQQCWVTVSWINSSDFHVM